MHKELVSALRTAAAKLNVGAATPLTDGPCDDSKELASYIAAAAEQIEKGNLEFWPELQRIFAPTSAWDDAGGAATLGNQIFAMLQESSAASQTGSRTEHAAGEQPRPRWNVDRDRLRLAVEGDTDGLRVPLPFFDRAQFQRFVADLEDTLLSEGISDAAVMQIGPGTTGWSGNPQRYFDYMERGGTDKGWFEYGAWKPGTDTDFVIFSDHALVQAMEVMEHNPQVDRTHQLFNNGEAPTQANKAGRPGFANAPLGAKLLQLALRWNQEIYGTPNPPAGGFDFKLNLDIDLTTHSPALAVYRGPECAAREQRRTADRK
ncbi:MAG: hypothetical protein LAO20_18790 [Acidobacteriia bacterium]|nr:hypothetical protein [Terriglobia bacterium]